MADGAGDADRRQVQPIVGIVEETLDPDDRVGLEQLEGRLLLVQAYRAASEDLQQHLRDSVAVHLEAKRKRLMRREAWSYAVAFRAGNGLMEAELATPVVLATERVVAEDLAALVDEAVRVLLDVGPSGDLLDGRISRGAFLGFQVPTGRGEPDNDYRWKENAQDTHGNPPWMISRSGSRPVAWALDRRTWCGQR